LKWIDYLDSYDNTRLGGGDFGKFIDAVFNTLQNNAKDFGKSFRVRWGDVTEVYDCVNNVLLDL